MPGPRLSLQRHRHMSEHWVVCGEETFILHVNESTLIINGTIHRLSNTGKKNLKIIEVQTGGLY